MCRNPDIKGEEDWAALVSLNKSLTPSSFLFLWKYGALLTAPHCLVFCVTQELPDEANLLID